MNSVRVTLVTMLVAAGPAWADELAPIGGGSQLLRTALGLVLILGLVFALAWAARRISGGRLGSRSGSGPIRIVAQQALGVKERLLLVEVGGRRILLGVSSGRIGRLADLGPAEAGFDERLEDAAEREVRG